MKKLLILVMVLLAGCVSIVPRRNEDGSLERVDSYGMFKDVTYIKIHPDGTIEYCSSKSNTADILAKINGLVGTGVGVARDLMP